jgi:hypothetical protein
MSMSIVELGALGEFVGSVAVLATLIYLVAQLKQNTRQNQALESQATMEEVSNSRIAVFSNRDVAELVIRGNTDPDSLDAADVLRFETFVDQQLWQAFQVFRRSQEESLHDPEDTVVKRTVEWLRISLGAMDVWQRTRHTFPVEFRDLVDAELGQPTGAALG